jgi:hypothetical protein
MTITTIHQPSFFPWLGLLDKIAKSNHFVFLEHVSVNKGSNQYRNTFYYNGEAKHITLPVNFSIGTPINNLKFKNKLWVEDHLNKFLNYYRKAHYFDEIFPLLQNFYMENSDLTPIEVIMNSMLFLFSKFNIKVEYDLSSKLNCSEKKGDMVLEICKKCHSGIYLSGRGAKNYMDDRLQDSFIKAGIELTWHNFIHPVYTQMPKYSFLEGLSSLDILFFNGIDKSQDIFWKNINNSTHE